jgi:hypothetical protein
MKAIDGKLKIDTTYKIISADYQPDDLTICDNCGLPISHICQIKDVDGHIFTVGADCAEGLISKGNTDSLDWWKEKQKLKELNQTVRYIAKLKKAKKENRLKIDDGMLLIYDLPLDNPKSVWSIRLWQSSKVGQLFINSIK